MIKRLLIISTVAMMLSACAAAEVEDTSVIDAFKATLAKQNDACADKTLVQSKAKIAEADALRAEGNVADAKIAEDAAMEAYKTENVAYEAAIDANNAQYSRIAELNARRDAMAMDAQAINPVTWEETMASTSANATAAQQAYDACDPETAKVELDAYEALMDIWADTIAEAAANAVAEEPVEDTSSYMYTVKKGDNLWEIAGVEYKNPFMWPIIYWTNKQNIKDPDLIFPGQNFEIAFDYTEQEMADAENMAKTRGSWSLYDNK